MKAKFIKGSNEYTTKQKHIPAPYFRKEFDLDFKVEKAIIKICTPGFYELFINGIRKTKGALAPYISNPDDLCAYNEIDVTDAFVIGKNTVGIILGNGFANQCIFSWENSKAPFRAPLCFALELEIYGDGKKAFICSDESFKTHPSPIIYDMYRHGTHYDARREISGWNKQCFDDACWMNALATEKPKGEIISCSAHPVSYHEEISPVSISFIKDFYFYTKTPDGNPLNNTKIESGYLYDFGENKSGVCRLKIKGESGQKITLRHSETLHEGVFSYNSIYTYKEENIDELPYLQTDVYILKGGEEEVFVPPFTYHGFRYVFVEGIKENQATKDLLTYIVINSDIEKRADFSCYDETLNKLYDMGISADLSNFVFFPTDCPHREKNGWTGDASVSAHQFFLNFDCYDSIKFWLKSVYKAQNTEGALPGIVPTSGYGFKWGNGPMWDSVCVTLPYYAYKYEGKKEIIAENADMIYKYLHYINGRRDEKGLIAIGLGDWCQSGRCGGKISAPLVLTDSCTVYDMAKKAAFLFYEINRKEEAHFCENLAVEMKKAIRQNLIDFKTMTASGNCQTSQAYMLSLGIFSDDEYPAAYKKLIEIIRGDKDKLKCGMIGLRHIFEVLIKGGDNALALKMITREDAPSYGNMIKRGATALCESLEDDSVNASQNHHFFGDILRIFISFFAGLKINPYMRDINEIEISPSLPENLNFAKAEYNTSCGKVKVFVERVDGHINITADIPNGIYGKIVYSGYEKELISGKNFIIV